MARKIKIPNEHLKRYARQEQKRKLNVRAKRMYYLIVCEGEATEPNYFEGLKQDLPKGVLTAYQIDIEGTGRNTQSLVDEALRLKAVYEKGNTRPIDRLWVVFDRDSFAANDFNNAVNSCAQSSPVIGCAWSNEAFELWYLLHFHYYQNAMNRRQYQGLIEENIQHFVGADYRYEKNSKEMYALLKEHGNVDYAIRNAKRLAETYGQRQDYANHNPCTMVWVLVKELLKLKNTHMNKQIIEAIEHQNVVEFYYEGELRVVEPHCYGETTAGNEGLRAYQIDGYSSTGKFGWKMYDLGKADDITITEQTFDGPREGYKRGDKGMSRIYAEL